MLQANYNAMAVLSTKKSKLDLIVRSTKISNLIFVFFAMLKSQHMRVFVFHILNVKKFILFANG